MKTKLFFSVCIACLATGISHGHTQTMPASHPVVAGAVVAAPAERTVVTHEPDGTTTTTTTTAYYNDFDKNHNGVLDSDEFYNYAYTAWDVNHDGYLSPDEWRMATTRWYGATPTQYKTYTYWDKNGDGRIDPSEFDTTVSSTNLYSTWATSPTHTINNDAYAAASFRLRDLNGDGVISMDEWRQSM